MVRVEHVEAAVTVYHVHTADGGDRCGGEIAGHTVIVSALPIAVGIQFIEAGRCNTGEQQTLDAPGEHVGDVELSVVVTVRQDHVGAEHTHRQPR
ncbi:Uncharacterised protein [Mycobacteroides abscessus subsp. abscessus]|nr:Uncharacterised protein [Mycobacteroides abscessus subsp. abscessus]